MTDTFRTEREVDIAIMASQVKVDALYQQWLTEFLGKRAQPLAKPDFSKVQTQLPSPTTQPYQAPQGAPPTQPNVGGY